MPQAAISTAVELPVLERARLLPRVFSMRHGLRGERMVSGAGARDL